MAVTLAAVTGVPGPLYSLGNLKVTVTSVTFDSAYVTAGEPLTAADLGLSTVLFALPTKAVTSDRTGSVDCFYDVAASKLVAYRSVTTANDAEVANGQNLSTLTCQLVAFGY